MAALINQLCMLSIFTFTQISVSEPLMKFTFQQPLQQPLQQPSQQPIVQPSLAQSPFPALQFPFLSKIAQIRAKLMALVQKKVGEINIIAAALRPNATNLAANPQLALGQQVPSMQFPQIPGLSQLAGSLQSLLPALQSAAMNPTGATGQPGAGVPTTPGQISPVQSGAAQPVATPGAQSQVQTPTTPQAQTQPQLQPVASPLAQPLGNPLVQQATNPLAQQAASPLGQPVANPLVQQATNPVAQPVG